ncbi:MFS transporter [Synergistaceae bacterium OttesenSCG-928-I11]|nr:MFS transporter [Synergistaceae bacterium OttesenSCG-928-I11]
MSVSEKNKKNTRRDMVVLLFILLLAGYFYNCAQRISAGVVLPHLAAKYGFSAALVGFLSSLFFYSYGFLQNIWGAVGDRIGPVKSCAVGLAVAGIGSSIMLFSHDPFFIGLSRLVTGVGLAAIFTGIYLYAALAFPPDQYPFWVGLILVVGNLGTVAAIGPLGALMDRLGTDGLYVLLTLWGVGIAAVLWCLRNYAPSGAEPVEKGAKGGFLAGTARDALLGFRLLRENRALFVITLLWVTTSMAMQTLQALWAVTWMTVSSGISVEEARFWATFISIGLVVGSPIGARVTVRSKGGRRDILWTMLLISLSWALYLVGAWLGLSGRAMGALGFTVGVTSSVGMVYCSSTVKSMVHLSRAGLAIGTGNMLIYVAVIFCQWGSGLIINKFPGDAPGNYLNEGYLIGFGLIVLCVWLSLFAIFSVRSFESRDV